MRRLFLRLSLGVIGAAILCFAQTADTTAKTKNLTAEDLKKLIDDKTNFFFLDVREPKEIAELGTMQGYVNIPLGQLEARLGEIPKSALVVTA
jgi:predicted sulfurtransferase